MSNHLCKVCLGMALGMTWGLGCLALGLLAMYCDWGAGIVEMLGSFYVGYAATLMGSVIGAVWGFVDGFIIGFLIAFFYNRCMGCKSGHCHG